MNDPRNSHFVVVVHVLRYLTGTLHLSLFDPSDSSLTLAAYSDADWGTYNDYGRSLFDYCVFLGKSFLGKPRNMMLFPKVPQKLSIVV